ncbi:MAG TPA: pilus assembly protein, partial [Asticcacaulis sp.]|nr:pilus assembly protein [Asticcacaulis sp.]
SNQYRMAIYHFGTVADAIDPQSPTPYEVSALTSDLKKAAKDAAKIDLMVMPSQGYNSDRQTNFNSMLAAFNTTLIPSVGTGMSAGSPQKVLFFVSDGANDSYDCAYSNGNTCRRITPLDTTTCTALKARGVRIAVLYTTYLPLPTNAFYNQWLAKYVSPTSQLAAQMQDCASPGLYFEVGPNQGISEAMSALFTRVISVVRINS